jgi:hypothetical protein
MPNPSGAQRGKNGRVANVPISPYDWSAEIVNDQVELSNEFSPQRVEENGKYRWIFAVDVSYAIKATVTANYTIAGMDLQTLFGFVSKAGTGASSITGITKAFDENCKLEQTEWRKIPGSCKCQECGL